MESVKREIRIDASPDRVWPFVAAVGEIDCLVDSITAVEMDGDIRRATLAAGGSAEERILENSDQHLTVVYEYVDGTLPLARYRSQIGVEPVDGGSRVTWTAELEATEGTDSAELAEGIGASYDSALANLEKLATS